MRKRGDRKRNGQTDRKVAMLEKNIKENKEQGMRMGRN